MPLDSERPHLVLQTLSRNLGKVSAKPTAKNIHQFRAYSRRFETLLDKLTVEVSKNDRKLCKLVCRLRKKAGRLRDLDVQIAALRGLKVPDHAGSRAQLLRSLSTARARRERKLRKSFDEDTVREIRQRLKRTATRLQLRQDADPLGEALQRFMRELPDHAPINEERMHQYRIAGKRVRYLAEFATSTESQSVLESLKSMQDALGEWHDWLTLTQEAEKRFGGAQDSALVAALRNLTRAKFRRALEVVMQTRASLEKTLPVVPSRRAPSAVHAAHHAAVA